MPSSSSFKRLLAHLLLLMSALPVAAADLQLRLEGLQQNPASTVNGAELAAVPMLLKP